MWLNPVILKGLVDDGYFDLLDGDSRLVDAKDTGALAWSWA
jgi:hypothetical protein